MKTEVKNKYDKLKNDIEDMKEEWWPANG
jgi:hypothetical protein